MLSVIRYIVDILQKAAISKVKFVIGPIAAFQSHHITVGFCLRHLSNQSCQYIYARNSQKFCNFRMFIYFRVKCRKHCKKAAFRGRNVKKDILENTEMEEILIFGRINGSFLSQTHHQAWPSYVVFSRSIVSQPPYALIYSALSFSYCFAVTGETCFAE